MPHALIVDDDTDTRDFLSEVARAEGFSVAAADTLRSARAQLTRRHPDVLLADLQLPDGNGMELIGDLDRAIETEIIVVTGHASVGTAVEALRAGATDYLTKPIEVERLANIGVEPGGDPPAETQAFVLAEIERWAKVVTETGTKMN